VGSFGALICTQRENKSISGKGQREGILKEREEGLWLWCLMSWERLGVSQVILKAKGHQGLKAQTSSCQE
jgi:hypothetical protein